MWVSLLIPAGSYMSASSLMSVDGTYTIIIADRLEDPAIILSVATWLAHLSIDDCGSLTFDAPSY